MKNYHYIFICIAFILNGCTDSIDNSEKRNTDWVWSIDESGNNGQWIPIGDKNNAQDGIITTFYDNGNKCYETRIVDDERIDTTWYYDFDTNNKLIKIYANISGIESIYFPVNGEYKRYYQSGAIHEEGFISNFQKGNFYTVYTEDGTILYREINDTLINKSSYSNYYPNGKIKDTSITINNLMEETAIFWYENGQIERVVSWVNNVENGEMKSFYPNGQLETISFYKNGEKDSNYMEYYETGILKYDFTYKNKGIHGNLKKYYPNGKIEDSITFNNGNQEGPFSKFYDSGEKFFEGQMINGKVAGTWFYSDGKLYSTCIYKDNTSLGLITYYTKSKRPFLVETIENDIIINIDTLFNFKLIGEEKERFENRREN